METETKALNAEELRRLRQSLRYKRATFDAKTLRTPGCWWWLGAIGSHGYGVVSRRDLAHRVAYERARGPIPAELTVDHLCCNRECVNPAHMELVTLAENGRRGERNRKTRSGGRKVAVA